MSKKDRKSLTDEERRQAVAEAQGDSWQKSLKDLRELFEGCLEEAHSVLTKFADETPTKTPSMETVVHLAQSMFSALVTVEASNTQMEMVRQAQSGLQIPIIGGQPGPGRFSGNRRR
jgi:hypothetical protein